MTLQTLHVWASLVDWTGGVDAIKPCFSDSGRNASLYVVVIKEGAEEDGLLKQTRFQVERLLRNLGVRLDGVPPLSFENEGSAAGTSRLTLPEAKRHASSADHHGSTLEAKEGFALWYADDYPVISLLGELGCGGGGLEACESGVQDVLRSPHAAAALASANSRLSSRAGMGKSTPIRSHGR